MIAIMDGAMLQGTSRKIEKFYGKHLNTVEGVNMSIKVAIILAVVLVLAGFLMCGKSQETAKNFPSIKFKIGGES